MLVLGSGKVLHFTEEQLKVMSMAYDEVRFVQEKHRRAFSLTPDPIEKLMETIKNRRVRRGDYE